MGCACTFCDTGPCTGPPDPDDPDELCPACRWVQNAYAAWYGPRFVQSFRTA